MRLLCCGVRDLFLLVVCNSGQWSAGFGAACQSCPSTAPYSPAGSSAPSQCVSCGVGCLNCLNATFCAPNGCAPGFGQQHGRCSCVGACCPSNQFWNGCSCQSCATNCLVCNSTTVCGQCQPGYSGSQCKAKLPTWVSLSTTGIAGSGGGNAIVNLNGVVFILGGDNTGFQNINTVYYSSNLVSWISTSATWSARQDLGW